MELSLRQRCLDVSQGPQPCGCTDGMSSSPFPLSRASREHVTGLTTHAPKLFWWHLATIYLTMLVHSEKAREINFTGYGCQHQAKGRGYRKLRVHPDIFSLAITRVIVAGCASPSGFWKRSTVRTRRLRVTRTRGKSAWAVDRKSEWASVKAEGRG